MCADLLCDSDLLDDWMKEVPSAGTPATFTSASPPKQPAGKRTHEPLCVCTLRHSMLQRHEFRVNRVLLSKFISPLRAVWNLQESAPQ